MDRKSYTAICHYCGMHYVPFSLQLCLLVISVKTAEQIQLLLFWNRLPFCSLYCKEVHIFPQ